MKSMQHTPMMKLKHWRQHYLPYTIYRRIPTPDSSLAMEEIILPFDIQIKTAPQSTELCNHIYVEGLVHKFFINVMRLDMSSNII